MTTTVGLKVGSVTACAVAEAPGERSVTCGSSAVRLSGDGAVDITDGSDGLRIDFPDLVPNPTPFGLPSGGTATVAELYAGAVHALLDRARGSEPTGADRIVLAVPADWDSAVIERVTSRCAERGVDGLQTVAEPIAAATWLRHFHGADEPVLVFDMGGHSLDLAVVGFDGRPRVLGTPTRSQVCTGDLLDDLVLRHVLGESGADPEVLESTDARDIARVTHLRGACRSAREALSTADEVTITDVPGAPHTGGPDTDSADTDSADSGGTAPASSVTLDRGALDALIEEHVRAATREAAEVIRAAEVPVGTVLLTGGCTDTPMITDIVSTELGLPVVCHPHPATTSAAGAALPTSTTVRHAPVPALRPAPSEVSAVGPAATDAAAPGPTDSGTFDPDREAITETLQAVVIDAGSQYNAYADVDEAAITEPSEPAEQPAPRERGRMLPLFGAAAAAAAIVLAVMGAVVLLNPSNDGDTVEADRPTITEPAPPAPIEPAPVADIPVAIVPEPVAPAPVPVATQPVPVLPVPVAEPVAPPVAPPPAAPAAPSEAPVVTTVPTAPAGPTAPTTDAGSPAGQIVTDVMDSTNGIVNGVLNGLF